jgi:hypothetical protein
METGKEIIMAITQILSLIVGEREEGAVFCLVCVQFFLELARFLKVVVIESEEGGDQKVEETLSSKIGLYTGLVLSGLKFMILFVSERKVKV